MAFTVDSNWLKSGIDNFMKNRGNAAGGTGTIQDWIADNQNSQNSQNMWRDLASGVAKEQGVWSQMDDRSLSNFADALSKAQGLSTLTQLRQGSTPGSNPNAGFLGDNDSSSRIANMLNGGSLYQNMGEGPAQGEARSSGGYGTDMRKTLTDLQNAYTSGNDAYKNAFQNSGVWNTMASMADSMFGRDTARAWRDWAVDAGQKPIGGSHADSMFGGAGRFGDWNLGSSGYGGLYGTSGHIPSPPSQAAPPLPPYAALPHASPPPAINGSLPGPSHGVSDTPGSPYNAPALAAPGMPDGVTPVQALRDGRVLASDGLYYRPDGSGGYVAA